MVLVTLSVALAGDCPSHPSPERFHARLEDLVEPVAFADPSAREELEAVLGLLDNGCVQGPVPRKDIVTSHLLRGAYAVLADKDLSEGDVYLRWATQWGKPDATAFGPDVETRIDALDGWGFGELDVTFEWEPAQVVIDGVPVYDQGVRQVVDGYHLVQWKLDDGWFGAGVVVGKGQRVHVGTGEPTGGRPAPVVVEVPVEVEPERPKPHAQLAVLAGYSVLSAQVTDGSATYGGVLAFPGLTVHSSWGRRLRLAGTLRGGPPPGPGRAPIGTELALGVGFATENWGLSVQGLGGLLPQPNVPEGDRTEPWFSARPAAGGLVRGTLGFGPASATVGGGRLGPASVLQFEVEIELPVREMTVLLVPRGQALITDDDRYVGAGVHAGVRFGL